MIKRDVIVVGGGASGLMAAISAAQSGAKVTILERDVRVGIKLLKTGNGRCNLSNASISKDKLKASTRSLNNPKFVTPTIESYDCQSIREHFASLGLLTIADNNGWVFPHTRYANSVIDVLRRECQALAVITHTSVEAIEIKPVTESSLGQKQSSWLLETTAGKYLANAVILTTGVSPLIKKLGLSCSDSLPILGPLKVSEEVIRGLDGVRVQCKATLQKDGEVLASESGEVLFKKQQLSGIVVFNLSRYYIDGCSISLDYFPDYSTKDLANHIAKRDTTIELALQGVVQSKIAIAIIRQINLDKASYLTSEIVSAVASALKSFNIEVTGMPTFQIAQVTRGGLSASEFDPITLESLKLSGIFAAGECLDIDGPCGGFNLHWAWASGIVAGKSAAKFTAKHKT